MVACCESIVVEQTLVSHFRWLGRFGVFTKLVGPLSAFLVAQTGSFDLLTLHVKAQITGTSDEEFVIVGSVIFGLLVLDAIEPIDVKLSLEGSVFCLIEILRHNGIGKLLGLVNLECLAGWKPRDDSLLTGRFGVFKNGMELEREGKLCFVARNKIVCEIDIEEESIRVNRMNTFRDLPL